MKLQDISRYFRDGQVSLAKKSLVFLGALYGVMPLDAIPDFIPFFGWLDDLGVIAAVTAYLWRDIKKHAETRRLESSDAPR